MRNSNCNSELIFQLKKKWRKEINPPPKIQTSTYLAFYWLWYTEFYKFLIFPSWFFVGPCFAPFGALFLSIIYMFTRNLYDEGIMGYKLCNKIWSLPIKLQAPLTIQWRGWYFILKVRTLPDNRQSYHVIWLIDDFAWLQKHFPYKSSAFNPVTCY